MKDKDYTLRLTQKEFLYVFTCVFGESNHARRNYPDEVRQSVEDVILEANGPTRDSGLGNCTCEDAVRPTGGGRA